MTYRFMKIWVLLLCSVFTVATFAQNSNSAIQGTVHDTGGAVVPGATIELTNVGTGQTLSTTSKNDGFYNFTNLSPANYKVSVTMQGFAQWVGELTLRVSQSASVDPTLTAASVSTQVTVRDVTPVIDKVNPTISDVKNSTQIETVPVANRSILGVLAYSPGVVAGNYGGAGGGFTRVNGVPGGSMDYLVDGQTAVNKWTNELQSNPQPTPTFQEVKIIAANGDAQYSRPGIVELVTKSGTNHFHGQIYELNRNQHLQARPGFNGATVPFLQHNEFGGQLGGPVWLPKVYNGRNKTFFFFDYEGIREQSNHPAQYVVPTPAMRGIGTPNGQADLSGLVDANNVPITIYDPNSTTLVGPAYSRTTFTGNIIPANRLNPVTQKVLTASYGMPEPNVNTGPIYKKSPNYEPTTAKATQHNTLVTAKVDQLFGPNRLAMRYTYTNRNNLQPGSSTLLNPRVLQAGGHNGAIEFTQVIGPHAINVARAGIQYDHNFGGPQPISPPITTKLGLPQYVNTIAWPGFAFYSYNNTDSYWSPIDRDNPKDYPDQTISASDQFSLNRGNHQMTFGFDGSNYRVNYFETGQPGGNYNSVGFFTAQQDPAAAAKGTFDSALRDTGSGLADFLLGEGNLIFLNVYPHLHTRQTELDGYAQDNWRATQRLTVNLGLRYSYWTGFDDASGVQSTVNLTVPGGEAIFAGKGPTPASITPDAYAQFQAAGLPIESAAAAHYPLSLWNMPKTNFEPRLGFAYELNDKTVLRGGWGIYQWVMPLQQFQQNVRQNVPFNFQQKLQPSDIGGNIIDSTAAELEFPIASAKYGGPQPLTQFMYGTTTWQLNPNNSQVSNNGGFSISPMEVNYKTPTVQEYNLTLGRELPAHVGFQLSYIGNHSYNLLQLDPVNYTIPRELAPPGATPAQRRAYPAFSTSGPGSMDDFRWDGYSTTNELQAQLNHTFGNGLLLQSSFTWQRTLTTTEDTFLGTNGLQVVPAALTPGYSLSNPLTSGTSYSERQRVAYAPDSYLPTKMFTMNGNYTLPFGRGKRFLGNSHGIVNSLVSGFGLSAFFQWHSGFYFSPFYAVTGSGTILAPGKTGILPESQRTRAHWFDASTYTPGHGTYAGQTYEVRANPLDNDFRNNVPRNYMTGPGFNRLDATLYKVTPIWRDMSLDFEAQFLNAYNHVNLSLPNNQGVITQSLAGAGTDVPRTIQLQAKILF